MGANCANFPVRVRREFSHSLGCEFQRASETSPNTLALLALLVVILFLPPLIQAQEQDEEKVSEGEKLFALKVQPIFADKCNACHGDDPEKIKGDLNMLSRESTLKGGEYFGKEVLIPGKGEDSFLYLTTTRTEEDYEMPPKEADKLTEQQTWWIRDWINAGAPWPDDERVAMIQEKFAEGEQVVTSKALTDDWQNRRYKPEHLWAYRPLKVKAVPEGKHPVDWFINRKLAEGRTRTGSCSGRLCAGTPHEFRAHRFASYTRADRKIQC